MRVLSIIVLLTLQTGLQGQSDLVSIRKSACFGHCPVYKTTVSSQGLITFHGMRDVPMEGIYERQLTKKEFRKLKCKLRKAKFQRLDDEYGMKLVDLPKTTILYSNKNLQKKVAYKSKVPEKLLKAEQYLISLTPLSEVEYEWTQIEKTPKAKVDRENSPNGRKEIEQETIIVDLMPNVDFEEWVVKYKEYGLRLNKKLVPNRPLYLLRHDPKTIPMIDLIKRMKMDSEVNEVEKNQKVKMRQ